MGLRVSGRQSVTVAGLGLSIELADGEEIGTEISAKFRRDGITSELEAAGFVPMGWWTDSCGDFAVTLAQRVGDRAAVDRVRHRFTDLRPRVPRPRSRTSSDIGRYGPLPKRWQHHYRPRTRRCRRCPTSAPPNGTGPT